MAVVTVAISTQSQLSLLHIDALRTGLPLRRRRSVDVLNKIHDQTHGEECQQDLCVVRHPHLLAVRHGFLRQFEHQLTSAVARRATSAEQKSRTYMCLDFRAGTASLKQQQQQFQQVRCDFFPRIFCLPAHTRTQARS